MQAHPMGLAGDDAPDNNGGEHQYGYSDGTHPLDQQATFFHAVIVRNALPAFFASAPRAVLTALAADIVATLFVTWIAQLHRILP
jgi:hypothetical protein